MTQSSLSPFAEPVSRSQAREHLLGLTVVLPKVDLRLRLGEPALPGVDLTQLHEQGRDTGLMAMMRRGGVVLVLAAGAGKRLAAAPTPLPSSAPYCRAGIDTQADQRRQQRQPDVCRIQVLEVCHCGAVCPTMANNTVVSIETRNTAMLATKNTAQGVDGAVGAGLPAPAAIGPAPLNRSSQGTSVAAPSVRHARCASRRRPTVPIARLPAPRWPGGRPRRASSSAPVRHGPCRCP